MAFRRTAGREPVRVLGLTENEYQIFCKDGKAALKALLDAQRRTQGVRIYQLDFSEEERTIAFAFKGIQWMYKAGFEQPPAGKYRLVYDEKIFCPVVMTDKELLGRLFHDFSSEKICSTIRETDFSL